MHATGVMSLLSTTWRHAAKADKRLFLYTLTGYFFFLIIYFNFQSPACDESSYFDYALRWAKGSPERVSVLDDSKTPMVFPALGILLLKPIFPTLSENYGAGLIKWGRLGMVVYLAILSWFLFCWLIRLLGAKNWYLPWLLFLLDPLIIANSLLIGSDIASAACWLAAAYLAWRLGQNPNKIYLLWLAFCVGIGLAIKPSLIFAFPMICVVYLATRLTQKTKQKIALKDLSISLLVLPVVAILVLNILYQGKGIGKSLITMNLYSQSMQQIRQQYPKLSALPLPVSVHWVYAYDRLLHNGQKGGGYQEQNSYRGVFLNGHYKQHGGFPQYYLVHFFYKSTPIFLLLLLMSIPFWLKKISIQRFFRFTAVWFPPLLFFTILSFTNPFQIGIRHALPVLPFMFIAISPTIRWLTNLHRVMGTLLICIHIATVAPIWPNLNAFTPFWVQPKHLIWQKINDSSLQYCSDVYIFKQFFKKNPQYKVPGPTPAPGNFAIRIEDANPWPGNKSFVSSWLTRYFLPDDAYKTTILLYHITPEDVAKLPLNP